MGPLFPTCVQPYLAGASGRLPAICGRRTGGGRYSRFEEEGISTVRPVSRSLITS